MLKSVEREEVALWIRGRRRQFSRLELQLRIEACFYSLQGEIWASEGAVSPSEEVSLCVGGSCVFLGRVGRVVSSGSKEGRTLVFSASSAGRALMEERVSVHLPFGSLFSLLEALCLESGIQLQSEAPARVVANLMIQVHNQALNLPKEDAGSPDSGSALQRGMDRVLCGLGASLDYESAGAAALQLCQRYGLRLLPQASKSLSLCVFGNPSREDSLFIPKENLSSYQRTLDEERLGSKYTFVAIDGLKSALRSESFGGGKGNGSSKSLFFPDSGSAQEAMLFSGAFLFEDLLSFETIELEARLDSMGALPSLLNRWVLLESPEGVLSGVCTGADAAWSPAGSSLRLRLSCPPDAALARRLLKEQYLMI